LQNKLGTDYPDTLTIMNNLALTYRDQGRWGETEKLYLQILEARTIKLVDDYPDILASMANLASIYYNQGR
jgi:hypothetical protein